MSEHEERLIRQRLEKEESSRNRYKYAYTFDALSYMMTWNESNGDVKRIIDGDVEYNNLPFDLENEVYKGMAFPDQEKIVKSNAGKLFLCEAMQMEPCRKEKCPLYIAQGTTKRLIDGSVQVYPVPLCREFKLAFER